MASSSTTRRRSRHLVDLRAGWQESLRTNSLRGRQLCHRVCGMSKVLGCSALGSWEGWVLLRCIGFWSGRFGRVSLCRSRCGKRMVSVSDRCNTWASELKVIELSFCRFWRIKVTFKELSLLDPILETILEIFKTIFCLSNVFNSTWNVFSAFQIYLRACEKNLEIPEF